MRPPVRPIFHLSFPVRDLDEAIVFYARNLGAVPGRRAQDWADIGLFGAQLTLQQQPGDVLNPMPRSRHFGATIGWGEWEALAARLDPGLIVEGPMLRYRGEPHEESKLMLADPSGNLIELKAYRQPDHVLGPVAAGMRPDS